MTITTTTLTRTAGLSAAVGGLLFIAVQIKHPVVDLALASTTEWKIREAMKVVFAALSLAGITGMYLRQVTRAGVLGLLGYLLFAANFLLLFSTEVIAGVVLPAIAHSAPGYVADVLAAGNGGRPTGDIGLIKTLSAVDGFLYVAGGLLFGTALFRANILARWAAALLAVGTVATLAIPLLPTINPRLFAIPTGIALAGLGFSLWREQRTRATVAGAGPLPPQLAPTQMRS